MFRGPSQSLPVHPSHHLTPMKAKKLKIFVAIASFGNKNDIFLRKLIQNYSNMDFDVDIVVFSNAPKNLDSRIKVVVGLPSKNPWSLPFAHKAVFAESVDAYDLFIYSEDDMDVSEKNIQAFLSVSPEVERNEIVGFLRYEIDESGNWSLPEVHGRFHWRPESVQRRGPHVVAEFTNEHAGFYILTQAQLRQAVASGGYLVGPSEGRYGMPETAATDPYTNCGFRKVICISSFESFLIHHLPNRYVGWLGTPLARFKGQVDTLMKIGDKSHPATTLCQVEPGLANERWSKSYDEPPNQALLALVPESIENVLTIGYGSGATEAWFMRRGATVTTLPLDSVVGAEAGLRGVEVIYGTWQEGLKQLKKRKFDCVIATHLIHLLAAPQEFLVECARCVADKGILLVSGPNLDRLPDFLKRVFGVNGYRSMRNFAESNINLCGPNKLKKVLGETGLRGAHVRWVDHELSSGRIAPPFGKLTARNWTLNARRPATAAQNPAL